MSHTNSSRVNIDDLMQKIREEASKRQASSRQFSQVESPTTQRLRMSNVEALLNAASAKSQVRTELPGKLKRFPWNISSPFGKTALRIYSFLFKEQRAVNFSLNQALRETLLLNQSLVKKVSELQTEISDLQMRIDALENKE
jgi:hypothetical protein